MSDQYEQPTASEAAEALASAERMRAAGLKRGSYSRGYAIATALWTGAVTTTAGLAPAALLPVFVLGLVAHALWRRKNGVWVWVFRPWLSRHLQQPHRARDLWTVILTVSLVGGVMLAGHYGGQSQGLTWAPIVAGVIVAVVTFALTEIVDRPFRRSSDAEQGL